MALQIVPLAPPRDVDPNLTAPAASGEARATIVARGQFVTYAAQFTLLTSGVAPAFFDLTDLVQENVRRSQVHTGQALIASAHTTCAVILQENEPLLLADLSDRLRRFAPEEEPYRHNDLEWRTVNLANEEERQNGHSHCQHALLGASVCVPVFAGELALGRWQRVLLVELDHPRVREVRIHVQGVGPED